MISLPDEPRYAPETLLSTVRDEVQPKTEKLIVAGIVDGVVTDLQTPVGDYASLRLVELTSEEGRPIYRRSVVFLLIMAARELFPNAEVTVRYSANKGLFCDISMEGGPNADVVRQIEARMRAIVEENRPIRKKDLLRSDAARLFAGPHKRQNSKTALIEAMPQERISVYFCGDYFDDLLGPMLDSTGPLGQFELTYSASGVLVRTPAASGALPPEVKQPKLLSVLSESKRWATVLHCSYIPDLNRFIREGHAGEIIRVSEALHEKSIAGIADRIARDISRIRLVTIAGPSSSGKTSFAQRLLVQLRVTGIDPISISVDDYYRNRADTPLLPNGEYDYECLDALDVALLNRHLAALLAGESVKMPRYNFITGMREDEAIGPVAIRPEQPIIIEGIHGLNEALTPAVPRSQKFKIYVSSLTHLNIDAHNRIPTTNARLLRRLVRDSQFRGAGALFTLKKWPAVRDGEERYIFPFQEDADAVFNSALLYELAVLKRYAIPLLQQVSPSVPEYTKAQSLLEFLPHFDLITNEEEIPNNSILREFIGRSCFFRSDGSLKT